MTPRDMESAVAQLKGNSAFSAVLTMLRASLQDERADYEDMPASEFTRGRVTAIRDLLITLTGDSK